MKFISLLLLLLLLICFFCCVFVVFWPFNNVEFNGEFASVSSVCVKPNLFNCAENQNSTTVVFGKVAAVAATAHSCCASR